MGSLNGLAVLFVSNNHYFSSILTNYDPVVPEFSSKNTESPEKDKVSSLAYKTLTISLSRADLMISPVIV